MEQQWRTLSGKWIKRPIGDEVADVISRERAMGHELKVCIGTDSQVKGRETEFATVIVFIRKGKGGFMYIHNETTTKKMSIKERMLVEVARSIEVAYPLCNIFSRYSVDMEVHADINTNPAFKSNDALKDAMGYIMGMGLCSRQNRMLLQVPVAPIKWCSRKNHLPVQPVNDPSKKCCSS